VLNTDTISVFRYDCSGESRTRPLADVNPATSSDGRVPYIAASPTTIQKPEQHYSLGSPQFATIYDSDIKLKLRVINISLVGIELLNCTYNTVCLS
jgi:hypothetical protein